MKETFAATQSRLEEQQQVDAIKIQEFNVSRKRNVRTIHRQVGPLFELNRPVDRLSTTLVNNWNFL